MRRIFKLAAFLLAALLLVPTPLHAARRPKKGPPAAAGAKSAKVVVTQKAILRAEASDIGRPTGKVKPKDKVDFVARSPDGKWVQVRKGKVAGWLSVDSVTNLPEAEAQAALPAPPPEEPVKPEPVVVKPVKPEPVVVVKPVKPEPVVVVKPVKPEPVVVVKPEPVTPEPVVKPEPVAVVQQNPTQAAPAPAPAPGTGKPAAVKLPLSGLWFSVAGGVALLDSTFSSTFKSGLMPELFNYTVNSLPAVGAQARLGYTFGYKWLRIGADGGYRFAGGTSIVVRFPAKDALPIVQTMNGTTTTIPRPPLPASRQTIALTAHDAEGTLSAGGYFTLGSKLEMAIRVRGGLQLQAFLPDFNQNAALPAELLYGPQVGAVLDFQTRFTPGFGLHVEGAYIPYAVRQENKGARDDGVNNAADESSSGFNVGASAALRILPGFDVELGYRLLSTQTTYPSGSIPERLKFDRDDGVKVRAPMEQLDSATRTTQQQLIYLGIAFRR